MTIKTTIKVTVRSNYGQDMLYPVCPLAKQLAEFARHKTFTREDIIQLNRMGFKVVAVSSNGVMLGEVSIGDGKTETVR